MSPPSPRACRAPWPSRPRPRGPSTWRTELLGPFPPGDTAVEVKAPIGVFVDAQGLVYVNDVARHAVLVFNGEGALLRTIGTGPGLDPGSLAYPNDALPLRDGSLLVADSNNNRLQLFDAAGAPAGVWAGPLVVPRGLALDAAGDIHVASTLSGRMPRRR